MIGSALTRTCCRYVFAVGDIAKASARGAEVLVNKVLWAISFKMQWVSPVGHRNYGPQVRFKPLRLKLQKLCS